MALARRWCMALALLAVLAAGTMPASGQPAGDGPATCRLGVNIEDLYDLNLAEETFGAVLWLWSLCPSENAASLDTISLPSGSALVFGEVRGSPAGELGYYQYRRIQGTFRHDWDMSRYPFDRQRLVIPIDETDQGSDVVVFEADLEGSFLSDAIRGRLSEWRISDLELQASVEVPPSTYGLPDAEPIGYARVEAVVVLQRANVLTSFKLTLGVFAAALIGLLTLFIDLRAEGTFSSRLSVLSVVLFGILLSMRAADAFIGDATRLTLVTDMHLVALLLIVGIALMSLIDLRRIERGARVRHPDWPMIAVAGGGYAFINLILVLIAATR